MPLFDDDLHGVVRERRVCLSLCTRPDGGTAGPGFPSAHVDMRQRAVVLPAGCQRCHGKEEKTPTVGKCWKAGNVVGIVGRVE